MTGEQYVEMLIEASSWEASEMESGFLSWCQRHVPTWRRQGYGETWIRQRIETAQTARGLQRTLREQSLPMLEMREELRRRTQLIQNSMIWRENASPSTLACFTIVGIQAISGNAIPCASCSTTQINLPMRSFVAGVACRCRAPGSIFLEQPDTVRVVRDLSTVEELELALALSRYGLHLFDAPESLTKDQLASLMEAHGKKLRAT